MNGGRTFNLLQQWRIPPGQSLSGRRERLGYQMLKGHFFPVKVWNFRSFCCCQELQSNVGDVVEKSSAFGSDIALKIGTQGKPAQNHKSLGAFQKLPIVMPSIDILTSAKRKARNVPPTRGIANLAKRERNKGAKQLDALMKELAVPLRQYTENFPNKQYLHPYERSLIELTLGDGNYEEVLGRVDSLRKKIVSIGKQQASLCAQSMSKREAEERLNEGLKKIEEVFHIGSIAVEDLLHVAKTLRAMPVVDLEKPTLCLVGAPNVGKSSLVRILSTGKPEVCNYPFTTRGILMGHIVLNYERFQVTDTPGLLMRHDEDRNNLERLTLAVLSHLPTAVLYVHDLSGECGTSPDDQFTTYKEMRERFSNHLWLDVVSKCDLLQVSPASNLEDDLEKYKSFGPEGAIRVSVKSEFGLPELKERVHDMLISQMAKIRNETNSKES
ncbi:nucleolar GTP-binding protein [Dioscorea alata]|uniref:Nucleolar GTP-binding protein n=4 Tax=Dioscorea alata TaxID=55571 RepID=A0ACB7WWK2_DIOAL|nr:nucleolar GTP-binding protein [Dioscorea alata]KAH7692827.1 nucleolar GTP-binding protein [Dioscorea alata]KAH7692828.1 nucleolar GTP-binding protein [Dioscorea alata]KAH7692829.1 nucleolar GTP-binding protein [Dioscorea alata]